jgi:hypothetical protein
MLLYLYRFLKERFSFFFLVEMIIGIIILVGSVTGSAIISNKVMTITIPSLQNHTIGKYVFILLHLLIIVYFIVIIRFVVQHFIKDKALNQTILSLIGPTIGGASLFYSSFLRSIVA